MINKRGTTTYLYIDASNLYGAISELLPTGNYVDFKEILACMEEDFFVTKIRAYGAYLSDEPSSTPTRRRFIGAQNKFFQTISRIPKATFYKGYFSPTSNKEKGIDVKLAVDMLKDAYEGSCKCILIMSGDDDFLYSIKCVRGLKIPVHLTAFATRFPYGIAHNINYRFVYDLNDYFKNKVLPNLKNPPKNIQIKDITNKITILSA